MAAARRVDVIGVPFNSAGTTDGVARAPAALRRAGLVEGIRRENAYLDVEDRGDVGLGPTTTMRDPRSGIIAPAALTSMIRAVERRVAESLAGGAFPLVLGGDCPILLGCLAALIARDASAGLVFIDGHDDAWPPERSPTGEAADMELGLLLGLTGDAVPRDLRSAIACLSPEAVAVLGPRDGAEVRAADLATLDELEPRLHYRAGAEVAADPDASAREAVGYLAGRDAWWLHLDLDVLSTVSMPAVDYRQAGGLDWVALDRIATAVFATPGVAGWTITIYNPDLDADGSDAVRIVAFIARALRGAIEI